MSLSRRQLEIALDKIFAYMEEKGIKIDADKKDELKKQITEDLHNELSPDDIKDVNVQKKLMACITSLLSGKDKDYKNIVDALKNPDKKAEKDDKLEAKLTAQLMLLTMLSKALNWDNKKENVLKPDEFLKKLFPKPKDKKSEDKEDKENKEDKEDDEKEVIILEKKLSAEKGQDEAEKQIDATLRNLYNGDNPTILDGEHFPIIGPTVGNVCAFTNQTTADPKGLSLMVESITFNAGKVDYMGLENTAMVNDMGEGLDMSAAFSPSLKPTHNQG